MLLPFKVLQEVLYACHAESVQSQQDKENQQYVRTSHAEPFKSCLLVVQHTT